MPEHPREGLSLRFANVYLHEVLDVWFETVVKPRLAGQARLYRYADDFVIVFSTQSDARRVLDVLPKRLGKYGLALHPEKTRLLRFKRPWLDRPKRPETFDLLGFTLYWAKSRKGSWVVKLKTSRSRFSRAVRRAGQWCRTYRHYPVRWQWQVLCAKVRGHYAYFGVTGNYRALSRFRRTIERLWLKWLSRRSQRGRLTSQRALRLLQRYALPEPRIVRPFVT